MDQGRMDTGAYCPVDSMVRETCDCIIGDAPTGAIPFGSRVMPVSGPCRDD